MPLSYSTPALFLLQEQRPGLRDAALHFFRDGGEEPRKVDLHANDLLENIDAAAYFLAEAAGGENQPLPFPVLIELKRLAANLIADAVKAGFQATLGLDPAELMWNVDDDRLRHASRTASAGGRCL